MKNRILILGIDTFARKNRSQITLAFEKGYAFDIVCSDTSQHSKEVFSDLEYTGSRLFCCTNGAIPTFLFFLRCLIRYKYHHVELYPAGKLGSIYAFVLWVFRYRFFVVERGDVGCVYDYPFLVRFSLLSAYRLASEVIYKETYMKSLLLDYGAKNLHFLPNCVALAPDSDVSPINTRNGFLWVNRVVKQRRAIWLVKSFASEELSGFQLDFLGLTSSGLRVDVNVDLDLVGGLEIELFRNKSGNTYLHENKDPFCFYRKSKFFCLPSSIVFGNNALLEAMSYGLIPIVTRSPGIELLVIDGVNGIVTEMNEGDFHRGLIRATKLSFDDLQRMSDAAIATVKSKYYWGDWINKLDAIYRTN